MLVPSYSSCLFVLGRHAAFMCLFVLVVSLFVRLLRVWCVSECSFSSSSSRLKPLNSKVIAWLVVVSILAQTSIEAAFLLDMFCFLFFLIFSFLIFV